MALKKHSTRVESMHGWSWSVCRCGWEGTMFSSYMPARDDGLRHEQEHSAVKPA